MAAKNEGVKSGEGNRDVNNKGIAVHKGKSMYWHSSFNPYFLDYKLIKKELRHQKYKKPKDSC